jgi:rare lipoprotein A
MRLSAMWTTRWRLTLAAGIVTFPLLADARMDPMTVDPQESIQSVPLSSCVAWSAVATLDPLEDPLVRRILHYIQIASKHRVGGLASYYSSFFDGRKTANGEIFRNNRHSAAHLTLPLGTWIEVKARATGKTLRMRVNDRGPYAKKFCLDLSQAAARALGVDRTPDRYVDIRIIALPGEEPLPEDIDIEELEELALSASAEPLP